MHTCNQCRKQFEEDALAQFGESWVCAGCKPLYVQKLKEGALGNKNPEWKDKNLDFALNLLIAIWGVVAVVSPKIYKIGGGMFSHPVSYVLSVLLFLVPVFIIMARLKWRFANVITMCIIAYVPVWSIWAVYSKGGPPIFMALALLPLFSEVFLYRNLNAINRKIEQAGKP